tara:strand:+ start:498 stop:1763 length:1266 start_codon:yes stop_codon:yes gene_type:complete
MNSTKLNIIKKIIEKKRVSRSKYFYPLLENAFSPNDLISGIKVIMSGQLTMSKKTEEFEKEFAKRMGSKFALMVNSGSSANLLSVFAAGNPARKNRFKIGDEVLIPSVCWPTSLWPLVQAGLKPVFVDVDKETLNVKSDVLIKKITNRTKVIMLVHVLGNSTNVDNIIKIAKQKKIIVIEDTCESLGSTYKNKNLGTFGDFGTYSFFYSHQITSGEGGMVVCNNNEDYELLKTMRSHGWSRGLKRQKEIERKNNKLDPRFIFVNSGFNLRPTDISASIGLSQFRRLKNFMRIRSLNCKKIINALKKSKYWNNQFSFLKVNPHVKPSYFGFPILLNKRYLGKRKKYLEILDKFGVETRPIISGNFLNQPAIKLFKLQKNKKKFIQSQYVENLGFFIGLHIKTLSAKSIKKLINTLFKIDKIK